MRVIAFAGVDFVALLCDDLDFPEFSIPVLVLRVVAEALQIECNEGPQYSVDHINIEGLDERTFQKVRKSLYVRPGDIYNDRLANLWLEKNSRLIASDTSDRHRMRLDVNENVGTVVLNFNFTRCAD